MKKDRAENDVMEEILQEPGEVPRTHQGTGETAGEGCEVVCLASTVKAKRAPTEQRADGSCGESGLTNSCILCLRPRVTTGSSVTKNRLIY